MPDATTNASLGLLPTNAGPMAGEIDERLFVASVGKAMKVLETFDKTTGESEPV